MATKRTRKKSGKAKRAAGRGVTAKKLQALQDAFLDAYPIAGAVAKAADAVGVSRQSHYRWLADHAYAERFAQAERDALDSLVHEAVHRARDGVMRLKFWQGMPIMVPLIGRDGKPCKDEKGETVFTPYVEYEKSDTLLIFLLKTLGREKFGDRIEQRFSGEMKHSGAIGIHTILETLDSTPGWREYARDAEASRHAGLPGPQREPGAMDAGETSPAD